MKGGQCSNFCKSVSVAGIGGWGDGPRRGAGVGSGTVGGVDSSGSPVGSSGRGANWRESGELHRRALGVGLDAKFCKGVHRGGGAWLVGETRPSRGQKKRENKKRKKDEERDLYVRGASDSHLSYPPLGAGSG